MKNRKETRAFGGCFIYSMGWPWKATVSEIWGRLTQSATHIESIYENRLGIKEKMRIDWTTDAVITYKSYCLEKPDLFETSDLFSLLGTPCADGTNQHSTMTAVCDTATHSKWQSVTSQETWWEWQIGNEPLQAKPSSILLHLFNWNRLAGLFFIMEADSMLDYKNATSIKTVMKDIARALVWSYYYTLVQLSKRNLHFKCWQDKKSYPCRKLLQITKVSWYLCL